MVARVTPAGNQVANTPIPVAYGNGVAGGWIGYAERTSDQVNIITEVDITGLSVSVTVNASRRIRVSSHVVGGGSVVGERYAVYLKEGSTQLIGDPQVVAIADNSISTMKWSPTVILTPTAGTHQYKLTITRITGATGNASVQAASTQPAWILVEDIGPA